MRTLWFIAGLLLLTLLLLRVAGIPLHDGFTLLPCPSYPPIVLLGPLPIFTGPEWAWEQGPVCNFDDECEMQP